jgi:hypothetical protein
MIPGHTRRPSIHRCPAVLDRKLDCLIFRPRPSDSEPSTPLRSTGCGPGGPEGSELERFDASLGTTVSSVERAPLDHWRRFRMQMPDHGAQAQSRARQHSICRQRVNRRRIGRKSAPQRPKTPESLLIVQSPSDTVRDHGTRGHHRRRESVASGATWTHTWSCRRASTAADDPRRAARGA